MDYLSALVIELTGIGVEGKYFLIKMLYSPQWQRSSAHTVGYFAREFGMTTQAISVAMEELQTCGYITATPTLGRIARGRPQRRLQISSDLQTKPEGLQRRLKDRKKASLPLPPSVHHEILISCLLETDLAQRIDVTQKEGKGKAEAMARKRHPLSFAGRLLLSVLLRYADESGAVRTLGTSDLCRLTGMSQGRLESQMDKLRSEGYIRTSVSGTSGGKLLKMAKGAHFLNLRHSGYGPNACSGTTIIYEERFKYPKHDNEANELYDLAFRVKRKEEHSPKSGKYPRDIVELLTADGHFALPEMLGKSDATEDFFKVHHYFSHVDSMSEQEKEATYLQMKIEEYASFLLTQHWEVMKTEKTETIPELTEKIKQSIFRETLKKYLTENIPLELDQEMKVVSGIIGYCAIIAAKRFYRAIVASGSRHIGSRYLVVSKNSIKDSTKPYYIVIEEFHPHLHPHSITKPECKIVRQKSMDNPLLPATAIESDLSNDDKIRYGLRSI